MKSNKIRVGITHGDINGIGYEVIIKTLLDSRILDLCTPIIYGSPKVAAYHRKTLNINNISFNHITSVREVNPRKCNIVGCVDENVRVELGKPTSMSGEAAYMALEEAVKWIKNGDIDVLVTAPINKHCIQSDRFSFSGHTEYFAHEFGGENFLTLMMHEQIKVGVVTGHIPLKEVAEQVSQKRVLSKIETLHKTLLEDFSIHKPRIAVLALNPHAGEKGILGSEEEEIIKPSIAQASEKGIIAMGPYPADGFFGSENYKKFDAVLAMYHDQGLIPFKMNAFDLGVNYIAGLPIIRTSPGHGTAYDIAGKGESSEASFRSALYSAIDIFNNRMRYEDYSARPLKKADVEKDNK